MNMTREREKLHVINEISHLYTSTAHTIPSIPSWSRGCLTRLTWLSFTPENAECEDRQSEPSGIPHRQEFVQASAGGCLTALDCPVIDVFMRTISTSLTWQPLNAPWCLRYATRDTTRDTIHTITYRTMRQNTGRCHACNLKTRASSEPFRRSRPRRAIHPWDGRGAGEDAPSGAVGWREVLHHDARELA